MSQAAGSRGGPFFGHVGERAQAGVLNRLLGRIEVAEITQQRGDRARPRGGERRFDPVEIGHVLPRPAGKKARTGLIS